MASGLKRSPKIWKLAHDLDIKGSEDPVSGILHHCEKQVKKFLKDVSDFHTLSELLVWIASNLGTSFEEIHSDSDLEQVKTKYTRMGERIFVNLDKELTGEVCGITYRRLSRESWEPQFVSIIDCRGANARKAYYTKWHELAHLLILTDQLRLTFRRTLHFPDKDPEEILVDIIAGKFGFYSPLVQPHFCGEISFEKIDTLRQRLCPEASTQASLIGFVKACPYPCVLLLCKEGLKKSEREQMLTQQCFDFKEMPASVLRAIKVTVNEAAKEKNIFIYENMRVPLNSTIHAVYKGKNDCTEAVEDLSWWQTSDGTILPKLRILIQVKKYWDDIYALLIPKPN